MRVKLKEIADNFENDLKEVLQLNEQEKKRKLTKEELMVVIKFSVNNRERIINLVTPEKYYSAAQLVTEQLLRQSKTN